MGSDRSVRGRSPAPPTVRTHRRWRTRAPKGRTISVSATSTPPAFGGDMIRFELDTPRRCALLVCELTSIVAPRDARTRLIEERRSHLHESARAGAPAAAELVSAVRGSLDDVRGSLSIRAAAGLPPLRSAVFTDATTSLAACAAFLAILVPTMFMEGVFLATLVGTAAIACATIVLFGGYATRLVQWHPLRRPPGRPQS